MKSTYKLIGQFWDRKPISDDLPKIYTFEEQPKDSVLLSYILKLKDEEIGHNISPETYKYLYVDYYPALRYIYLANFYSKRLLQIANYLNLEIACDSDTSKDKIEELISTHFKSITE